ncbi:MAG: pyridoxamine 5'-phosphate oxidase family protein, partial [Acidimicrobiales bacterium]
VSTPVWFITDEQTVLVAGPGDSVKFQRIAHDPRVSVLAETGDAWRELRAVRIDGRAEILETPDWQSIDARFEAKYAAHRTPRAEMAPSAVRRYDRARALVRITPTAPLVSWDNRKLTS